MRKEVKALKPHVSINVRNVIESIEFYRKMLGVEPAKVRTGYAKFDVQNPPLNFALNEVPFNERGDLSHMGIQVASIDDVLAVRMRWADEGLITRDEMQTNCCYAIQDKTWVTDPDGNEWEVFVVLEDNLPETEQAIGCCAPTATSAQISR
jgi:catechol 2,3-dioxygenase-like lactoylglutathione lyase family enzyme